MKVIINKCFGGFSMSEKAIQKVADAKNISLAEAKSFIHTNECRTDEDTTRIVESMGEQANTYTSKLKVINIPNDVNWYIEEYDGYEHVEEVHRIWE